MFEQKATKTNSNLTEPNRITPITKTTKQASNEATNHHWDKVIFCVLPFCALMSLAAGIVSRYCDIVYMFYWRVYTYTIHKESVCSRLCLCLCSCSLCARFGQNPHFSSPKIPWMVGPHKIRLCDEACGKTEDEAIIIISFTLLYCSFARSIFM